MFATQLVGTIVAGVVNYLTAMYLMNNIPNICTQKNTRWTCPNANIFFSASIIWGAIGMSILFLSVVSGVIISSIESNIFFEKVLRP